MVGDCSQRGPLFASDTFNPYDGPALTMVPSRVEEDEARSNLPTSGRPSSLQSQALVSPFSLRNSLTIRNVSGLRRVIVRPSVLSRR